MTFSLSASEYTLVIDQATGNKVWRLEGVSDWSPTPVDPAVSKVRVSSIRAAVNLVSPPDPPRSPAYLAPFSARPSGAGYSRWEDLVTGGDDVTRTLVGSRYENTMGVGVFQTVVARCPANNIVTFPGETFEINQPNWNAVGADSGAVRWPKTSRGLIGNVPTRTSINTGASWDANLNPNRTIIRVKANTAPIKNVGGAWFQAGFSGSQPLTIANIHFEGTEQGFQSPGDISNNKGPGNDGTSHRLFTNVFLWNTANTSTMRDCFSTGSFGNNGAPPGETFNYEWYHTTGAIACRCDSDGRRQAGGLCYSAVGLTFGNALNPLYGDSWLHHNSQAGFVNFQTYGSTTYDIILGDPNDHTTGHVNGRTHGDWFNLERAGNNWNYRMTLNDFSVGGPQTEHISHSGDVWALDRDGSTYQTGNGLLKMIDPKYSNILFGGKLAIAAWGPQYGANPSAMLVTNPPQILQADGVTKIPAKWHYHDTPWRDI